MAKKVTKQKGLQDGLEKLLTLGKSKGFLTKVAFPEEEFQLGRKLLLQKKYSVPQNKRLPYKPDWYWVAKL